MTFLIRIKGESLRVEIGEGIQSGDVLGLNTRTLEPVESPVNGVVADILVGAIRNSMILVVDSFAFARLESIDASGERVLVGAY